jgi:hypothetical protein
MWHSLPRLQSASLRGGPSTDCLLEFDSSEALPPTQAAKPQCSPTHRDKIDASGVAHDGRRLRRQRNRQTAIDAYTDLATTGVIQRTRETLTTASGISGRSISRYFHGGDALISAVASHITARFGPTLAEDYNEGDAHGVHEDRNSVFPVRTQHMHFHLGVL